MEVTAGFRRTEAGVLPDEWQVPTLGELVKITSGASPSLFRFTSGGIPYFKVDQLNNAEKYLDGSNTPYHFERGASVPERSVVFAKRGAAIALNKVRILKSSAFMDTNLMALTPVEGLDCEYLFYALGHIGLWRFADTTSVPQINNKHVKPLPFPLPSDSEQRAIAAALSDVDALLAGLDRLIAKKRDLKQAAMQQLLTGATRLPGFGPPGGRLNRTEVGLIPEDWPLARLGDLVEPQRGIRYGIVQPGKYDPNGRFMVRGQDYSVAKGWADPAAVFRVSPAIEEPYRNSRVRSGDLIMTIVGYCGHVEVVPHWLDGANLTQTTARIAVSPGKAVNIYCKYALLSTAGRRQVNASLKGAAQPGLNCGDVAEFLIPIPSMAEQAAIGAVFSDLDAELKALETRRDKTRALKQGMMQELLTGRTRLV